MSLVIENVSISYGQDKILENINMSIEEKQVVSIIGRSGVGKTTLFNAICSLLPYDSGKISLNGEKIDEKTSKIAYMLQKDMLLPFKTVIENIILPLVLKGQKKEDAIKEASSYLSDFGLEGYENEYPSKLSGGMKQRAALLRTYLMKRKFFLLDEPFSALDYITRLEIRAWYMKMAKKYSLSTIFITHDVDESLLISDKIYILSGKPAGVAFEYENHPTGDYITLSQEQMEIKSKLLDFLMM